MLVSFVKATTADHLFVSVGFLVAYDVAKSTGDDELPTAYTGEPVALELTEKYPYTFKLSYARPFTFR
jgi:hypothetical protein